MNLSEKRLKHDLKIFNKNKIDNVFVDWTEDNLYNPRVFIIGPKDTPYENGFYGIEFKFTEKFPFEPPKAKFVTTDTKVRMNPNLYANGKVCLSLLGTWSGPQWTSCQNLYTIVLSIMTILNDTPIRNEPGYEKVTKTHKSNVLYNQLIEHANLRVGVIQMIEETPKGFEKIRDEIIKYFKENYNWYKDKCIKNELLHYKQYKRSPIYSWREFFNYKKLKTELKKLKKSL